MSSPPPRSERILVVDDDRALVDTLTEGLADRGYQATGIAASVEAVRRLGEPFDALVTDLRMPGLDGLGLLAASKRAAPERPVIVMTAYSAVDSAIESIRQGAYHYLTKPFKVDELSLFLERALAEAGLRRETRTLRKVLRDSRSLEALVGESQAMRDLAQLVRRIADENVPVLILGETGTGKGLVARALHAEGAREGQPFVTVNCAALPEPLLESELFGHVRGAFTGATSDRRGLFEEAAGGTVFLDEVGEMSPALQAKLLDVLERSVVRPVGGNKERRIEARLLAATHRDLPARVAAGQFREDLMFRLDVVTLEVPPLRHRPGDIPLLLEHFLAQARKQHPRALAERFSKEAMGCLLRHSWPGNVRELEHLVLRTVLLANGPTIELALLPPALSNPADPAARGASSLFASEVVPLLEMQRRYAAWALDQLGGRKMATAERLDVDPKTLAKLLALPAATRAGGRDDGSA